MLDIACKWLGWCCHRLLKSTIKANGQSFEVPFTYTCIAFLQLIDWLKVKRAARLEAWEGGGELEFYGPFFSRGGVMFEGCKLQTWPEQLLFHEVEKVTNISPFSVALPLYPRCVPSSLVVERGMVPGIMGRKEDFYNHSRTSVLGAHTKVYVSSPLKCS